LETLQHRLQKFNPGIVWLDSGNRVMAMNGVAAEVLAVEYDEVIGEPLLQLHPEKSRDKVEWLLEKSQCPLESPPPMTMMINIPDRLLLIKVSKMIGAGGMVGTCMVFFDLTDITTIPVESGTGRGDELRRLFKLPVYCDKQVILLDLEDIAFLKADGHYTTVLSRQREYLCNLSLADLEGRLDKDCFIRVHRSYLLNINFAKAFKKVDEQYLIVLNDNDETEIPISRGNAQEVKEILGLK